MSTTPTPAPPERATVIGINFGNSYASIAVITKEGTAECIANEDGERQIAAAISFHGEEMYVGNQATPQLVKNAENTITAFRDVLSKKYSEIDAATRDHTGSLAPSARIISHPTLPDTPAYAVQVLIPSPSPLPPSSRATPTPSRTTPSAAGTPARGTPLATPRSEPIPQTRHITPHDAAVLFLRSLHTSAAEFLGKTPEGAVLCVPGAWGDAQRDALREAAREAGVNVLAVLGDEAAAASALVDADDAQSNSDAADKPNAQPDRTTLLVDWGATSLTASLLTTRAGLVSVLASREVPELGTAAKDGVDEVLVKHFAKEFSKKTGEALKVCPPTAQSSRAQTKLFTALPHVKRSLTTAPSAGTSAQKSSTQISVESLHVGLDFSASLNRTRTVGLLSPVFSKLAGVVRGVLDAAEWTDKREWVDRVMWVGGGGRLGAAGALDALVGAGVLGEQVTEEQVGAPEEVLARGCAVHAALLISAGELRDAFSRGEAGSVDVAKRTLGVLLPEAAARANGDAGPAAETMGGRWIPVVWGDTPLPARRTVRFSVTGDEERAAFEVWEVCEVVHVRKVKVEAPPLSDDDDADDAEEEEEEEREKSVRKEVYLGSLVLPLSPPKKAMKKGAKKERRVEVRFDVGGGGVEVRVREEGGEWVTLSVGK